jgi:hypothetical protein
MISNEPLRYFWRRRIWRGISPGRAAVCGVRVVGDCERRRTYIRALFGCWGRERVLISKRQGNKKRREEEKRIGSDA